jgi:superfamily II DNA or RNA helicase
MNAELKTKLENAIRLLASLDPDYSREENEVGFNGRDTEAGHSLARQIGRWTPAQYGLAWKICSTYRNTQLADLEIPPYDKQAAEAYAEAAVQQVAATVATVEGWGLPWSPARSVSTKYGQRTVSSAVIPVGHPFWSVWKTQKEALKAKGYGVSQDQRGLWQVSLWTTPSTATATPTVATKPQAAPETPLQSLSNPEGLLAYQIPSVQRLVASLKAHGAVLDASDVGTGKTYSALAACRELGYKPLVICPKAVIPSWKKAAKHFGLQIEAINYELVRRGSTPWASQHTDVRGSTSFTLDLSSGHCNAVIFDEVHRCKGQSSLNSKLLIAAKRQGIPTIALSATAATDPTEMKALGYLLGLFGSPGQHWSWCQNNGCDRGSFGGIKFSGASRHLSAIHSRIFPSRGSRIRVADLGDAFPETQITVQTVELNGKTKEINEAYRLAQEAIDRVHAKQVLDGDSHLTLMLRARQISEAAKLPLLSELAADAVEQGLSVAIFLNFQDSIDTLSDALNDATGARPVLIHGGQTAEERQQAIDAFQSDKARVIVANIQAGGVGISLHDLNGNHPRLALVSPTWSAVDLRQTLGRVHRAGGKTKSLQRLVYAAGTVEERVAAVVEAKLARLDNLNDGDTAAVHSPNASNPTANAVQP